MSYAYLNRKECIIAIDKVLQRIYDLRNEDWENAVKDEMKKTVGWFSNKRTKTREKAERYLKNGDNCFTSTYETIFVYRYTNWENRLVALENLLLKSEDELVAISPDSFKDFSGYYKREGE